MGQIFSFPKPTIVFTLDISSLNYRIKIKLDEYGYTYSRDPDSTLRLPEEQMAVGRLLAIWPEGRGLNILLLMKATCESPLLARVRQKYLFSVIKDLSSYKGPDASVMFAALTEKLAELIKATVPSQVSDLSVLPGVSKCSQMVDFLKAYIECDAIKISLLSPPLPPIEHTNLINELKELLKRITLSDLCMSLTFDRMHERLIIFQRNPSTNIASVQELSLKVRTLRSV